MSVGGTLIRVALLAWLACFGILWEASPAGAIHSLEQGRLFPWRSPALSAKVRGVTPQTLAWNPSTYVPMAKFPAYDPTLRLQLKAYPERKEYYIGQELTIIYSSGARGFASLISYSPDGYGEALVLNKPVNPEFTYAFRGQVGSPSGVDYLRLLLSVTPLSRGEALALIKHPFSYEYQNPSVVREEWLRVTVVDPFRRSFPHWGRFGLTGGRYFLVQPIDGDILAYGIEVLEHPRISQAVIVDGRTEYWELGYGDRIRLCFGRDILGEAFLDKWYLVIFPAQLGIATLDFSKRDTALAGLRIICNGLNISRADEIVLRDYSLYPPPRVLEISRFLLPGTNFIELEVDDSLVDFLPIARIELRDEIDGII